MELSPVLHVPCALLLLLALRWGVRAQQAFRTQPRNLTVRAGATALLKCEVLRPSGAIQWVKDGLLLGPQRALPGFPRYSVAGDERRGQYHLQIVDVALDDDSPYECQVGRSESSRPIISHTVWINVQIPPSKPYIELDSGEPWVAGEEYTVTCVAPDAKPAADITLFKDGVELTGADSFTMSGSEDKLLNTHAKVKVRAQSSDDGRRLACQAKNPALHGVLETSVPMTVYFPPQAPRIEGLDSEEVKKGTSLRLVCVSHGGNPLATLHWTKNGEVLSTTWEEDIVSRKASSVLSMEVTLEDNHAMLRCESVNQVSPSPLSISRTLTVLFEPEEVKVLGSFQAIEGKEVTLCCHTSSSNPPVQIRWWLGFRELNTTVVTISEGENGGMMTMSNLTHKVSREENGLPLSCETFNKGTRFSSIKANTLNVHYPPQKVWLDVPPEGVPLRSGATVRLVCFSNGGNPTGSLTWFKNGKSVWGVSRLVPSERGVSRDLLLTLQPSDNLAAYRCDASNQARKVLTAQTKLLVQFPAISVKIVVKQQVLRKGQTLSLECLAGSSNPRANVSWSLGPLRLQGVEQDPQKADYGGQSVISKLSLPLGSHHHGARVTCQAFSALLNEGVNTFYTLNVLFPPEFAPDLPRRVQVVEDEVVTLPVAVSANPGEVSCEWTYRGEKLVKERDPRFHWTLEGSALEIRNVTRRDGGDYVVACSNEEGKGHTTVKLDVHYTPSVKMKTDPVFVDVGDTADLLCEADANPITPGMFSWKWLGEGEVDMGEESEDGATGLLTIFRVTRAQAGRYQCTADNGIAPGASVEVQLTVRFKPELQKGAQWSKVASRGDGSSVAEVVCQAEGNPRVGFTWAKNGAAMDFSNPRYLERTVREGSIHTSTLTVVNVSAALDYAVFTCTARNSLGEDSLDIQLLSTNHPDPPSELKLLSITYVSVRLEWMPGFDGGLQQKFRVRYRWVGSASYLYVDVFPPRATVYTVTGLSPATVYNFSVNALNAMGESSYADNNAILTVTTGEQDPAEREAGPDDRDSAKEEASSVPLYLLVILVVGGVLLVLNALGCFLFVRWRKRRGPIEDKSSVSKGKKTEGEGSTVSTSSNRYESGERINTAAQRTLLISSGSETDSSAYESYGVESSHYYYPTEGFRPSLPTHLEGPEHWDGRYHLDPFSHDYEEVRDWGAYQDLQGPSLPLPSSQFHTGYTVQQRESRPAATYTQGRGRGVTDLEPPIRGYNSTVEGYLPTRDSDLPFELRGELV